MIQKSKKIKTSNCDRINIKFKGIDNFNVYYSVRASSSISELFQSFCELKNIDKGIYEIVFNGIVIQEYSTIGENNINEDDTVIVRRATLIDSDKSNGDINLIVNSQYSNQLSFKVKKYSRIETLKEMFAQSAGFCKNSLRFVYGGYTIEDHFSPSYLDMSNGDTIDVVISMSSS